MAKTEKGAAPFCRAGAEVYYIGSSKGAVTRSTANAPSDWRRRPRLHFLVCLGITCFAQGSSNGPATAASRWANSMSTWRTSGLPALISPASACRPPLLAFRGVTPQKRANCFPERKRSTRPISARSVAAVTNPTPARASNRFTIGSSLVRKRILAFHSRNPAFQRNQFL